MRRTRASLTAVAAVAAVVLAACGTADTTGGGGASGGGAAAGSEEAARNGTADGAARGGTLNILGTSDVDYIDPQITYYSTGYTIARLYHRELFAYPADPATRDKAVPDLAEQLPTTDNGGISADGKTYTITIKQGAQWNTNPPRQVTAADTVIGVKRSCNPAQPFGGLPDFQDLIAGFKQFCDGFADVGQDAPSIKKYIEATPLPGVVAKDDRHPGAALAVARPGREPQLRSGQHRAGSEPGGQRPLQD
jgi:peptide/nickel transport system substrate-binding protein